MISILFADDELLLLKIISAQLNKNGFDCDTAKDGEEAIKKIKEKKYNLILLDISMPKKNGNQVLCETRKILGVKTPIFILTGDTEKSSYKICIEDGANEYITKPYNIDFLISKINEYKKIFTS